MYQKRIDRVLGFLEKMGLGQMIVCDLSSIRYLTGIDYNPHERLFALYISTDGRHKLFLNNMFKVPKTGIEEIWFSDTDDTIKILASNVDGKRDLGIDKNWPARFLLPLMEQNSKVQYRVSSECVDRARSRKDEAEKKSMRAASLMNDQCLEKLISSIKEGMSEKDCVELLVRFYREAGASGVSFDPIVAFGENTADPHHKSGDTVLKDGDCVLVDTGCIVDGYCSDITRTYFYGTVDPEAAKIHDTVREANEKAEALIKPGIRFCDLDKAARDYISGKGYGERFTHRLGHSIGLDCHEWGDVSSTNTDLLEEGMCFSIEPGIYLPGKFGVRVEDLVIVTRDGCEVLNRVEKKYKVLPRN